MLLQAAVRCEQVVAELDAAHRQALGEARADAGRLEAAEARPSPSTPLRRKRKISCIVTTSPSMPVISCRLTRRRRPSLMRSSWSTTWSADEIWPRIERSGKSTPVIMIICSSRESASRGVLAWIVVIEPSWPVFIACSMSSASAPRTSPTMIRSGRMRSALRTRSCCVTAPRPSMFGGRVSIRATCVCCSWSSAESSIVMIRSRARCSSRPHSGAWSCRCRCRRRSAGEARLDDAVEQGRHLLGDPPLAIRRSIVSGSRENLRIESSGPSSAQGGMIALMREPSARRASTQGWNSSTRRPTADTMRSMMRSRWRSSLNCTEVGLEDAVLLDEDLLVGVDQDVGDRRVLEQRLERAEAQHLVEQLLDQEVELARVERGRLVDQELADDGRARAAGPPAGPSRSRTG